MSLPALAESSASCCAEGRRALFHCHGTAVVHSTGRSECLDDPACRAIPEVHTFVAGCDEIDCDCQGA
ncbi:MAG TPA: hypothetical protein VMD59_24310 [Acidimicrobiales bacterium]|nr:hypothetical protein [Acidimicrobiales bacterium]